MHKNNFVKFLRYACFLIALTRKEEIGTRSGRAGPSFSVRPEKEAKGAVLHGTSAAERLRHVKSCSANLPKLDDSHRLKHMGRFVFALRAKIPSRATQSDSAGAASASRQRPAAHKNAGSENNQKPCFFVHSSLRLYRQAEGCVATSKAPLIFHCRIPPQKSSFFSINAVSSSIGRRTCSIVSRSRTVTQPSVSLSKS